MKRVGLLFILLLNISLLSSGQKSPDTSFDSLLAAKGQKSVGLKFPNFKTRNNLTQIDNNNLKRKITYINFWFKDCPPCIAEMRSLNDLYDQLRYQKDFQFFSFTFEGEKTIDLIRNKYKIQYPIFHLSKTECYRLNQDSGFPVHIILDKQGVILFLLSGYHTDLAGARDYLFSKIYPVIISALKN